MLTRVICSSSGEAVLTRHLQIEHCHVRMLQHHLAYGLVSVGRDADNLDSMQRIRAARPARANHGMIIGQDARGYRS